MVWVTSHFLFFQKLWKDPPMWTTTYTYFKTTAPRLKNMYTHSHVNASLKYLLIPVTCLTIFLYDWRFWVLHFHQEQDRHSILSIKLTGFGISSCACAHPPTTHKKMVKWFPKWKLKCKSTNATEIISRCAYRHCTEGWHIGMNDRYMSVQRVTVPLKSLNTWNYIRVWY